MDHIELFVATQDVAQSIACYDGYGTLGHELRLVGLRTGLLL